MTLQLMEIFKGPVTSVLLPRNIWQVCFNVVHKLQLQEPGLRILINSVLGKELTGYTSSLTNGEN